jgi:ArsR family transcriptional regulator, zinc-responsive transcriptional repressor
MTLCKYKTYHHFFSNLANPLKINLIISLSEKSKNVTELSTDFGVEQSKISHALASLRKCNIVNSKQNGKQRVYSLNKKTIVPLLKLIDNHAQTQCEDCIFRK